MGGRDRGGRRARGVAVRFPGKALAVAEVYAPGSYHDSVHLNSVVNIGGYTSVRSPDEPILVRMTRVPCSPGLDPRSQFRAGQAELLATSFETFERNIRDQLARILAPGGFDPAADITDITVNRWPHGYAYEYNPFVAIDQAWRAIGEALAIAG